MAASPQKERISKISARLSEIQIMSENEKQVRLESAEQRLHTLEDKVSEFQDNCNKKLAQFRDQVTRVQRSVEEEISNREFGVESRDRELGELENRLFGMIETVGQSRKESESKILRLIDEKFNQIRNDLFKESKIRVETLDQISQSLESDIPRISETLQSEQVQREDSDASIMKRINDELAKVSGSVVSDKKAREETEGTIFSMIKDIVTNVKSDLEFERKEREEAEETLLNLLENTCSKINAASKS
eukprot:TRINITY_DN3784_c0_g1_i2.p2 TRINITY_DN3784_c0_g1~~TRINITY_DN3784_c0_g1_i2.p2  ORF type:complete len:248 (-),score=36.43 TRINITY_DN3784_c0_g1_i2:88-831(-)